MTNQSNAKFCSFNHKTWRTRFRKSLGKTSLLTTTSHDRGHFWPHDLRARPRLSDARWRARPLRLLAFVLLVLGLAFAAQPAGAQQGTSPDFDHLKFGFPLTGVHADTDCGSCHVGGVFKGTPTQCSQCHNGTIAPGKTLDHVVSNTTCENCHI